MSGGGRGLDPRFMQELKQKNDIAEVIGSYVALDKKGGNYWACCPFHHEKTPSFAVNESEQFYHCFGCGASGDVVKFVQEIESTDFMGGAYPRGSGENSRARKQFRFGKGRASQKETRRAGGDTAREREILSL